MSTWFREITVIDVENLPTDRGAIIVSWHPGGLFDNMLTQGLLPGEQVKFDGFINSDEELEEIATNQGQKFANKKPKLWGFHLQKPHNSARPLNEENIEKIKKQRKKDQDEAQGELAKIMGFFQIKPHNFPIFICKTHNAKQYSGGPLYIKTDLFGKTP